MKNLSKKAILLLCTSFFLMYCDPPSTRSGIPYIQVNLSIFITNPQYLALQNITGSALTSGGSRGILIYRNGLEDFNAFDRHCTYEPENSCGILIVDSSSILALDTCCGSKFSLTDGSPVSGAATIGLEQYRTNFNQSTFELTITN